LLRDFFWSTICARRGRRALTAGRVAAVRTTARPQQAPVQSAAQHSAMSPAPWNAVCGHKENTLAPRRKVRQSASAATDMHSPSRTVQGGVQGLRLHLDRPAGASSPSCATAAKPPLRAPPHCRARVRFFGSVGVEELPDDRKAYDLGLNARLLFVCLHNWCHASTWWRSKCSPGPPRAL